MQHGQSKACGFARAGLRASEQIVPRQHGGNGLFLNGGRGGVVLFLHGLHNGRCQFQIFKVHSESGAPRFFEKGASRTSPICRTIMCIDERGRPVESRLVGQIGKGGPFLISPQPQQTAVLRQTGGPQRKARLLHEKRFCWRALSFNRIQRPPAHSSIHIATQAHF